MKKLCVLILACVVFLASCGGGSVLPETAEPLEKPAQSAAASVENEKFLLEVDESGRLTVTDKASGNVYSSTPDGADEDELAQGINKSKLKSDYFVTLVNSSGATTELNSFDASVSKDGVSVEKTENGVRVWYLFPDQNVMFAADYSLDRDGFAAEISYSNMTEQFGKISGDDWGFMSLSVMPFFDAAGADSQGYMVVPDGSGAVINHNNKKSSYASYAQELYGRDPSLNLESKAFSPKVALIPVFGSLQGAKGYAAVITDGEAQATIYAETSGVNSGYNNVYAGFAVRRSDGVSRSVSNGYGGSSTLSRTAVSSYVPEDGKIRIKYMLLGGESLSYVSLAKAYRKYLIDGGMTSSVENAPLYLSFTGGISDTEYTLGIPHKTVVPVTKFREAAEIINDLKGVAPNIVVRYAGWQKGGLNTKTPKSSKTEKKLGGDKAFKELADTGAEIFPELDLVNFYKGGSGLSLQSDCTFSLSGSAAYVYKYAVNTGERTDDLPSRLLNPKKAAERAAKFDNKNFSAISLGDMGSTVFSEFSNKAPMSRDETADIYGKIIENTGERVMVTGGNSYALSGADCIYALETEATLYDLEDGSIPFYQIALHGLRSYSVPPINLTADSGRAMLKALETGSSLCYSVCGCDIEDMNEDIGDAPYDYIGDTIKRQSAAAMPVIEAVCKKEIINHEKLAEDVYKTTFRGGAAVYVNYSSSDVSLDGRTVKAEGFLYEEGE